MTRKPSGYWTKELCERLIDKCTTIKEMRENHFSALQACKREGWHKAKLAALIHQPGRALVYTFENCQAIALRYDNLRTFRTEQSAYYDAICRNEWPELTEHMFKEIQPHGYWNDKIESILASYEYIGELRNDYPSVYAICASDPKLRKKLKELKRKPTKKIFWTFEKVQAEALKYNSKVEFRRGTSGAYARALIMKWIDQVCAHMKPLGNLHRRAVYSYIFSDGSVYVGLTCNLQRRHNEHQNKSLISKLCKRLKFVYKVESDYVDFQSAQKIEFDLINKYKSQGFKIRNRAKAGALGPERICPHTYESVKRVADKYKRFKDFRIDHPNLYAWAYRLGYVESLCKHMEYLIDSSVIDEARVISDMKKSTGRHFFKVNFLRSYLWSTKNGTYKKLAAVYLPKLRRGRKVKD